MAAKEGMLLGFAESVQSIHLHISSVIQKSEGRLHMAAIWRERGNFET